MPGNLSPVAISEGLLAGWTFGCRQRTQGLTCFLPTKKIGRRVHFRSSFLGISWLHICQLCFKTRFEHVAGGRSIARSLRLPSPTTGVLFSPGLPDEAPILSLCPLA